MFGLRVRVLRLFLEDVFSSVLLAFNPVSCPTQHFIIFSMNDCSRHVGPRRLSLVLLSFGIASPRCFKNSRGGGFQKNWFSENVDICRIQIPDICSVLMDQREDTSFPVFCRSLPGQLWVDKGRQGLTLRHWTLVFCSLGTWLSLLQLGFWENGIAEFLKYVPK